MTTNVDPDTADGPRARLVPLPAGPYEVTGPVELVDPRRTADQAADRSGHLCRCGRSANKPFCDGSHARTGWTEEA